MNQNYPIRNTTISLGNREIQLTVIDEPDRFLEKLSREDSDGKLYLPYWTYLWESAIGLAHHIAAIEQTLSDQHILEIGCGFGLAGIAACHAGAKVVFTDFEREALLFAQHNAQQNGADSAVFVQMDWNAPCFQCQFDVILAADVIYEEHHWQPILVLLRRLLAPNGIALFSEPNRKNADGFFINLQDNGFTYQKSICTLALSRSGDRSYGNERTVSGDRSYGNERTAPINIYTVRAHGLSLRKP